MSTGVTVTGGAERFVNTRYGPSIFSHESAEAWAHQRATSAIAVRSSSRSGSSPLARILVASSASCAGSTASLSRAIPRPRLSRAQLQVHYAGLSSIQRKRHAPVVFQPEAGVVCDLPGVPVEIAEGAGVAAVEGLGGLARDLAAVASR